MTADAVSAEIGLSVSFTEVSTVCVCVSGGGGAEVRLVVTIAPQLKGSNQPSVPGQEGHTAATLTCPADLQRGVARRLRHVGHHTHDRNGAEHGALGGFRVLLEGLGVAGGGDQQVGTDAVDLLLHVGCVGGKCIWRWSVEHASPWQL